LIENSSVSGNMTTGFSTSGGGIYAGDGAVTVLNSTVSGNSLVADHSKGAGIFAKNGNIVVTNSTLSGNTTAGAYGSGVAVYAANGDVTLTNSTVTNNSAGRGWGRHDGAGLADGAQQHRVGQYHRFQSLYGRRPEICQLPRLSDIYGQE
jgi:hypothetical protein